MLNPMPSQFDFPFPKQSLLLGASFDVGNDPGDRDYYAAYSPHPPDSLYTSPSPVEFSGLELLNDSCASSNADLDGFYGALFASQSDGSDVDPQFRTAISMLRRSIGRNHRLNNDYKIERVLGFGTFGVVVEARDFVHGNNRVAIKIISIKSISECRFCFDPTTNNPNCPTEIYFMKTAPVHPNLIRYIDSWNDEEFWYLVTELAGHSWTKKCDGSMGSDANDSSSQWRLSLWPHTDISLTNCNDHSLAGFMRFNGGFSPNSHSAPTNSSSHLRNPVLHEPLQRKLFRQLVSVIAALHANNIAHADIKDENFLVDSQLNIRLIDFGHASRISCPFTGSMFRFSSYGTHLFAPPEWRSGQKFGGPQADVYALGLVLYEMSYGDLPARLEQARAVVGGKCIFDLSVGCGFHSPQLRQLLLGMLCPDPAKRFTISKILCHPWLIGNESTAA